MDDNTSYRDSQTSEDFERKESEMMSADDLFQGPG